MKRSFPVQGHAMSSPRITRIFETLERMEPAPQTALEYTTPFSLLVSVLLSAQAPDRTVNRIMASLRPLIDTPQKVVDLGEEALAQHLKSLNFYRNKAHNVVGTACLLLKEFHGTVPLARDDLMRLPGVGPKTANAVLNILIGADRIAVDTHVFRLSHRLGLSQGATPDAVEQDLYAIVPKQFWSRVNHWFTGHGRTVCKARRPKCSECSLAPYCPSKEK